MVRKFIPFVLVVFLITSFFEGWQPVQANAADWITLDARANKLDPALQTSLKKLQATDLVPSFYAGGAR